MKPSNEFIQSTLARAIIDVEYFNRLESNPAEAIHVFGAGSTNKVKKLLVDISRFSAFRAKVQNNFLRNDYKFTLGVLERYSLEIEVFSAYLPIHQINRKDRDVGNVVKTERFADFLNAYLKSKKGVGYQVLNEIFQHEDVIRRLKAMNWNVASPSSIKKKRITATSKILPNGYFLTQRLFLTPSSLKKRQTTKLLFKLSRRPHIYFYWMDSAKKNFQIVEISVELELIINSIGAGISIANLGKKLENKINEQAIYETMELLCNSNFITIN